MNRNKVNIKWLLGAFLALLACATSSVWAGQYGGGSGGGGSGGGSTTPSGTYDTSFAQEYEYSCMTGGCHETNTYLVTTHAASYMTHVMVKCNACHGTHTAAEVGKVKPNLTGYTASSGVTGYKVPKDRCLTCHSATLSNSAHPKNPNECISCHAPHTFDTKK